MRLPEIGMPALCLSGVVLVLCGCSVESPSGVSTLEEQSTARSDLSMEPAAIEENTMSESSGLEFATFGAGCYWCTEAIFQRLEGVEKVVSGFMGGSTANPTYEEVCQGSTGHAEVIHFNYDPSKIGFQELLEVFFKTHDPTTLNRQGADVGTQYRSVVFYHSDQQRQLAEQYIAKLDEEGVFEDPIVTEVTAATDFYSAKGTHQNFYNNNPYQGYCNFVIRPKVLKLESVFAEKLKQQSERDQ